MTSVARVRGASRRRSRRRPRSARPSAWLDLATTGVCMTTLVPCGLDQLAAALPHHPGAVLRVLELLDEAGDVLLVPLRAASGVDAPPLHEREVLDALGGPVGLDLGGRHAPDLLGVGLEEVPVEAPAEAGGDAALERCLVLRRADPRPEVRQHAAGPPRSRPRLRSAFDGLERVVEELARRSRCGSCGAAAGSPRRRGSRARASSTGFTLVKKRWPPMSKRQPSRSTVRLMPPTTSSASRTVEVDPPLAEHVGRGEAGGAGADDDDVAGLGAVLLVGGVRGGGRGHRVPGSGSWQGRAVRPERPRWTGRRRYSPGPCP